MKYFLILVMASLAFRSNAQPTQDDIWINEFHYDGATLYGESDVSEFIEVVAKTTFVSTPAEVAKYKIVLFTSGAIDAAGLSVAKGVPYNVSSTWYTLEGDTEHRLSEFTTCPAAATGYSIFSIITPIMQDVPAAMALIYDNTVLVQLLSYEKSFGIINSATIAGPAAGLNTTLILNTLSQPAKETALTTTNHSISLTGSGSKYDDFAWDDAATILATPCAVNQSQTLTDPVLALHWLNFNVAASNNSITAHWVVANEEDAQFYDVQLQNVDGSFETRSSIPVNLNNEGKYRTELSSLQAGVYYVRIKTVNKDGSHEFSTIKTATVGIVKNGRLTISPNPVQQTNVRLQISPMSKAAFIATIFDATGRAVLQQNLGVLQPDMSNTLSINVNNLANGVYQIKLTGGREIYTSTFQVIR